MMKRFLISMLGDIKQFLSGDYSGLISEKTVYFSQYWTMENERGEVVKFERKYRFDYLRNGRLTWNLESCNYPDDLSCFFEKMKLIFSQDAFVREVVRKHRRLERAYS